MPVDFQTRQQHRPAHGNTQFITLFKDLHFICLDVQHGAVGFDLVVNEISRIMTHGHTASDGARRADRHILGTDSDDAFAVETARVGDLEPVTREKLYSRLFSGAIENSARQSLRRLNVPSASKNANLNASLP